MRGAAVLIAFAVLAACGADGDPVQPTRNATVSISDGGISAETHVGVVQGPLSLSLGLGL